MGSPYHQPVISHSASRLTIDSDSEPDSGDAVDSARTTKRFLFRDRYSYRESSQQPELARRHSQLYEQREGQCECVYLCIHIHVRESVAQCVRKL